MRESAGILLYRNSNSGVEVMLVHPGGPFWAKKDLASWSIPKGEFDPNEDAEAAARREFAEEVGHVPDGQLQPLGQVMQNKAKRVFAFALEGDFNVAQLKSNVFDFEWPPKSGRFISIPEVDRAEWFSLEIARTKLLPGQVPLIDRLEALVASK